MCYFKKENQELKLQLKGTTHCFDEEEHEKLKKQLEEKTKIGISDHKYASECEDKVITMENQQKEFIEYLENMLDDENDIFSVVRVKDVLQKYREIVNGTEQNWTGDDK